MKLKEIKKLYWGHTASRRLSQKLILWPDGKDLPLDHSAFLPPGNTLPPCHLSSTFFLHSICKPQMGKRQWSIKQWKEKGFMNIFFNIIAIGMCVIEWRQFMCSSLVFSTSDSDFAHATDQVLWSRSFLMHSCIYYLRTSPSLILLKCYSAHTRILQVGNLALFIATPESPRCCRSYPFTSYIISLTTALHHLHPLLPLNYTPSFLSRRYKGVNYIIFLWSINYVNFGGNNIKYGNFSSLFSSSITLSNLSYPDLWKKTTTKASG